ELVAIDVELDEIHRAQYVELAQGFVESQRDGTGSSLQAAERARPIFHARIKRPARYQVADRLVAGVRDERNLQRRHDSCKQWIESDVRQKLPIRVHGRLVGNDLAAIACEPGEMERVRADVGSNVDYARTRTDPAGVRPDEPWLESAEQIDR